MMEKWTTEEAVRHAFQDWRNRQMASELTEGDTFTVTMNMKLTVPAAYAKAILKDVLSEELEKA